MKTYPDTRPNFRNECYQMSRPCPFISCRYHFLDTMDEIRSKPDYKIVKKIMRQKNSCVLDIIDKVGEVSDEQLGKMIGVTRQRIHQIRDDKFIEKCFDKIRAAEGV